MKNFANNISRKIKEREDIVSNIVSNIIISSDESQKLLSDVPYSNIILEEITDEMSEIRQSVDIICDDEFIYYNH